MTIWRFLNVINKDQFLELFTGHSLEYTSPIPNIAGRFSCNTAIKHANEHLVYFGPGKISLIKFINVMKLLLPCLLKEIMKMLSLGLADSFKLNVVLINGNKTNYSPLGTLRKVNYYQSKSVFPWIYILIDTWFFCFVL